jgi:4-amino-4-deoxy-L-arabinose transferase
MSTKHLTIGVFSLFLVVYISLLGTHPLTIPSEARYAEIPREILASNDWIVPHLNGMRYFEKTPLGYWLEAGAMWVFGENLFANRLPTALAAGFSAWWVFILIRRFGKTTQPIVSALIYLTFFQVFLLGITNVLDGMLTAFLTGAVGSFFVASQSNDKKEQNKYLFLLGIFCGLAFLIKGFLAFVVPFIVIIAFMIWEKRAKDILSWSVLPIISVVLICLPWGLAIHVKESDFWHYFFWVEHINRFSGGESAQHASPIWYFIPILLGGALPWTFLIPAAFYNLKEKLFTEPLYRFSLLWLILPFAFFSFSSGKLSTYILPCYAPLAILLSEGLVTNNISNKLQNWGIRVGLMIMVLALLVVISAQFNLFKLKPFYQPSELHKVILIAISLMVGGFLIFKALIDANQINRLFLYGISLIGIMLSIHFVLPQKFLDTKAPEDFFIKNQHLITPQTVLISDAPLMHAVNWIYKRNDVYLFNSKGEMQYGLSYPDAKHRYLEKEQLVQAIQARHPLAIIHEDSVPMQDFPLPTKSYQQGVFVLDYYQ